MGILNGESARQGEVMEEVMHSCRKKGFLILIFVSNLWLLSDGIAHDDKIVHPRITAKAVEGSTLEIYLRSNLGILEGTRKVLGYDGKFITIQQWLQEGSRLEDDPICRV
jgi:hypothetical protein